MFKPLFYKFIFDFILARASPCPTSLLCDNLSRARFSHFIDSLSTPIGVLNYVSFFTLSILNISLRIGAKNLGLLISTTFIKIPLSSTAHYSENDYYNRKYSCYPNSRTAASNDATDTESYPQIIPSAHFFHIVNTSFAVFTIFYSKAY